MGQSRSICPLNFLAVPPSFGLQALDLPVLCRKCSVPCLLYIVGPDWSPEAPGVVTPLLLVQQLSTICRRTNTPSASTILSAQADLQCQLRSSSPSFPPGERPQWNLNTFQIHVGLSQLLHLSAWRGKTKVWLWCMDPGARLPVPRFQGFYFSTVQASVPSPLCSSVSHLPNGLPFGFSEH